MDPMIQARCLVTITWHHCTGIARNLDKTFDPDAEVQCYEWQKTSFSYVQGAIVETTKANYYIDLGKYPIQEDDELTIRGKRRAIKRIDRYNHPIYHNEVGVIIC